MTLPVAAKVVSIADGMAADTVTLDEAGRNRRRIAMTSDGGIRFLLDLSEARLLRHGDGLQLSDGRIIAVRAKPEPLYRVHPQDALHLLRLAWHLGNRHCPAQIDREFILIRRDHTLRAMLEGLGAEVEDIEAPFDPEGGAYDGGHHHHD
ncbi:urease accessory protein UreE [Nitratireductor sp. XY-223]|uniref:urease accessory protein UreE n=1 Tax=Nitratireductor sp. XY-223 TaxID=2561926 RepID=UPI0032B2C48A